MTDKTAKWIFWTGTLISLVLFLVLTVDTQRQFAVLTNADRLDETVVEGKRAFERHNCNDCHTILGFGGYYAPDLTRVYTRLGEVSIRRRLEEPEVAFADSYRKMPQQNLTEDEILSIIAYFRWVADIENNDWPPQHSEETWKRSTKRILARAALSPGAALVKQEGCLACHRLGSEGGDRAHRLEWIGTRRDARWIADYLEDPQEFAPGTLMPSYGHLSGEQRLTIGEFVVSLGTTNGR